MKFCKIKTDKKSPKAFDATETGGSYLSIEAEILLKLKSSSAIDDLINQFLKNRQKSKYITLIVWFAQFLEKNDNL